MAGAHAASSSQGFDVNYHIYPLGFLGAETANPAPGAADGPVTHRLRELVGWLDYLQDLGVTALLVGPVFESETHGYDTVDPFRVDRRLGDEADLIHLIDECHRRSMRIALDGVFNHVGRAHPHFQDVIAHREQSAYRDWFKIDFDKPGYDGFQYATFEGHGGLVELNHDNPEVAEWAGSVAEYWIERGVDGVRLDAAYTIPVEFLASLARRIREGRPEFFLMGEVIHGDYKRIAKRARLSSITQFELWKAIWSALNDGNFFELSHAIGRHAEFCERFAPWTFIGNHDTTRIASKLNDPRHAAHAAVLLFTLPGMPAVYAGDEQGAKGRNYDRPGGDDEVRLPPPYRPGELSGDAVAMHALYRELIALRRARPWLATANVSVGRLENRVMTYEANSPEGALFVALSVADEPVRIQPPAGMAPMAGDGGAKLGAHGWGVWATEQR